MTSDYKPLTPAESCRSIFMDTIECFICRDDELHPTDPLRNFCDCKNLLAHHACLSTWIQTGHGSEDRLRCIICKAKYQLQWRSPWWSVSVRWQTWLVLMTVLAFSSLVPYVVYCLMTTFINPPPPSTFKVAAASFGLLTEILLVKCLWSYLSRSYRQAEQNSFTVRARCSKEEGDGSEATPAAALPASPAALSRKEDILTSGHLSLF